MLRQVSFILMLLACIIPSTSYAQAGPTQEQVQEAQEHFSRAELAFGQERWLECATHFEQSFTLVFAPEILYNIGLCYERASENTEGVDSFRYAQRALNAYSRYLRELPEAEDTNTVRARVSGLRTLLDRERSVEDATPTAVTTSEEDVEAAEEPEIVAEDLVVLEEDPPPPEAVGEVLVDRGFGFGWTVVGGAFTLASFVTAVGLGIAAQLQFNDLVGACGQTVSGCSTEEVRSVVSLATGANALFAVSGVLLAATGVALGLEFHFWSTPKETQARVGYSHTF